MKPATLGLAACLAVTFAGVCWAQDLKATQRLSDTQIGFDPGGNYGNYTLSIVGPNGFHASAASKTGTPAIDLRRFGKYDDGAYSYQLTASSDEKVPIRTPLDNGRGGDPGNSRLKAVALSGQFLVKGGTIVMPSGAQPTRLDKDAR